MPSDAGAPGVADSPQPAGRGHTPQDTPSQPLQAALVSLLCNTATTDLPPDAIRAAEIILADGIATGIAGASSRYRDPLLATLRSWGEGAASGLLASPRRLPAVSAAFMHAFQMHCLEFDAVHEAAVAHVATTPLAALLAEVDATQWPITGERFLTALVVGIEVAATLGVAANAPLTFFRPATSGIFGAVAAIAWLRQFGTVRINDAFGHALSLAAGTMQPHEEGTATLPLQMGVAARAGIMCADLAEMDIPTSAQAIDGKFGYLSMFESHTSTDGLAGRLARPWRVTEMSLKPFPSGRATHGGIEAVLELRERGLRITDLASAELFAPPLINHLVNRPAKSGMNGNYARLCFPYVAAVALGKGHMGLEDFSPGSLMSARTLAFAERFRVRQTDAPDAARFTPQRLVAVRRDGTRLEIDIEHLLGAPEHPMTTEQRERKITECCAAGGGDETTASRLLELANGFWQCPDSRALLEILAMPPERGSWLANMH